MPDAMALIPSKSSYVVELRGTIDGFPEESFELGLDTGDSPLESGASVTDHAVATPERLILRGQVRGTGRAADAIDAIRRAYRDVETVTFISPLGVWDEMLIKRMSAPRAGHGLTMTLELEQVIRVGLMAQGVQAPAFGPATERTATLERGRTEASQTIPDIDDALNDAVSAFSEESIESSTILDGLNKQIEAQERRDAAEEGGLGKSLRDMMASMGSPSDVLKNANRTATEFKRDGVLGLVRQLDKNLNLPPEVSERLTGHAATAVAASLNGDRGLAVAEVLSNNGAPGLGEAVATVRAAQALSRTIEGI